MTSSTRTGSLRVRDVMQQDVVTVPPDMTVRELTRVLSDEEISGAPVVDAGGRTVGVVSATDVLRLTADEVEVHVPGGSPEAGWEDDDGGEMADLYDFFVTEPTPLMVRGTGLAGVPETQLDEFSVGDIMTPATFTVPPEASVRELAEFLLRGRIHRALVMEDGQLLGIVTSFDVLRAVLGEG